MPQETLDRFCWIRPLQQGPVGDGRSHPADRDHGGNRQIERLQRYPESGPMVRILDPSPAWDENHGRAFRRRQFGGQPALPGAERRFPRLGEQRADRPAGGPLDLPIDIDTGPAKPLRDQGSDRALSRAGQPHQDDRSWRPRRGACVGISPDVRRHAPDTRRGSAGARRASRRRTSPRAHRRGRARSSPPRSRPSQGPR